MFTIEPLPRSTIDGSAARQVWNAAVRSVADDGVPLVGRGLEERPDQRQAGVVDEAVDAPEALDDALDEAPRPGRRSAMSAAKASASAPPRLADPRERPLARRRATGGSGRRRVAPSAAALTATSAPIPRLLPVTSTTRSRSASPSGRGPACRSDARPGGRRPPAARSKSRMTSSVGRTSCAGSPPCEDARRRATNPRRPSSRSGSRTVDSAGAVIAAIEMSSNPATDTSPGTSIPSSASRSSAPSASRSLAQAIAVNGAAPAEQRVDARAPPPARSNARPHDQPLVERDARLGETAPVAGQPIARDEQRDGAGQERDPPVPELDQRGDHRRDPAGVVDAHVGLASARAATGGRPPRRRRASPRGVGRSPR